MAVVIEVLVFFLFGVTILFLVRDLRSLPARSFTAALIVGILCAVALEIINERLFAGQGAVYPVVFVPFYPFKFPVAIVLFTGLYAATVAFLSFTLADRIVPFSFPLRLFTAFLLAAIFNFVSLAIEHGGIALGWWYHQRAADLSRIYPHVYLFYAAAVFPATAAFAVFRSQGGKR